jgi:hypothetical protein
MSPQEFNNRLEALKNGPTENLRAFIELLVREAFEKGVNRHEEFRDLLKVFHNSLFKEDVLVNELLKRMGIKP